MDRKRMSASFQERAKMLLSKTAYTHFQQVLYRYKKKRIDITQVLDDVFAIFTSPRLSELRYDFRLFLQPAERNLFLQRLQEFRKTDRTRAPFSSISATRSALSSR
jgi:histone deacetylase complex regulatory component SIN3